MSIQHKLKAIKYENCFAYLYDMYLYTFPSAVGIFDRWNSRWVPKIQSPLINIQSTLVTDCMILTKKNSKYCIKLTYSQFA